MAQIGGQPQPGNQVSLIPTQGQPGAFNPNGTPQQPGGTAQTRAILQGTGFVRPTPLPQPQATGAHHAFLLLVFEVLAVAALAGAAELGPGWRRSAVGLVVILWIVFLINHGTQVGAWLQTFTPNVPVRIGG